MPILGIRLDDMPADRIAYVWVDAHLLQAFYRANLCFLLAFHEWSELAEGENRPEPTYFTGSLGGDLQDGKAFQEERESKEARHSSPLPIHTPRYFSTQD